MFKPYPLISTTEALTPTVDFSGTWQNELQSEMHLNVDQQGHVTGKYKTGIGTPNPSEEVDLVGFASADLLSFTVNFGTHGSLTCWSGQHILEDGVETIKTKWLLTQNLNEVNSIQFSGNVVSGQDNFYRSLPNLPQHPEISDLYWLQYPCTD